MGSSGSHMGVARTMSGKQEVARVQASAASRNLQTLERQDDLRPATLDYPANGLTGVPRRRGPAARRRPRSASGWAATWPRARPG